MVMFETTLMCNMFCEYCIFGEEGKFNDLKTRAVRDRIFKRIDEMCDLGIFALSFSGGEPLLKKRLLAEGIRLLVNEAMIQERSHALKALPYERTDERAGPGRSRTSPQRIH